MSTNKSTPGGAVLGFGLLAAAAIAFLAWRALAGGGDAAPLEGASVTRGPLRITVTEKGNLRAGNSASLKSGIEGNTTILYLIQEGTWVEPGTLLCELDATEQVEQRVSQEISVKNAEAAFIKARTSFDIQESQNESDQAQAKTQLELAEHDLRKAIEGDWPQKEQDAEQAIMLAREQLQRAEDKLAWSQKLAEKGFLTRTELEADELEKKRAEIELDQAQRAKTLFVDYDVPRERKELEANVDEARRELARVELQALARMADAQAAVDSNQAKLELESERLAKVVDQIEKARITAPVAGMVVYAQQDGGRWGQASPIAEGTSVYERQEILQIPAADSGMIAEASFHESVIELVQEGQLCSLTIEALPGRSFQGRVKFKAPLPDKNSWFANPNLRLYRTQVELVETVPEMRPGMSCSIEVQAEEIADATYVPVQAVFLDGGAQVCFKRSGSSFQRTEVQTGKHSSKFVQILAGLDEGDVVAMALPPGVELAPAIAPEWPGSLPAAPPGSPDSQGAPASPGAPRTPGAAGGGRDAERSAAARPAGPPAGAAGSGAHGASGGGSGERSEHASSGSARAEGAGTGQR